MHKIDSKYSDRKVYYLKDILDGRTYFAGDYATNELIVNTMSADAIESSEERGLLSHAILDIKDVIFPPRVEQLLYDYIKHYNLVVIDTSVEERDCIITVRAKQFLPDGTRAKEDTQVEIKAGDPIVFRHNALMQYRERVEFSMKSLDLSLYEMTVGDTKRFTRESTREVVKALETIQKSMQNQNDAIYINPSTINYQDEATLREVSALLIKLVHIVKIPDNYTNMTSVREGILPAIGQLCFNYESFIHTIYDIKRKFKVGDKLPLIYGKEIYFVTVTQNPEIPDNFDIMSLTEEDLRNYFYIAVRDVNVNSRLEIIFDETEEEKMKALESDENHAREVAESKGYRVLESDRVNYKKVLSDLNGAPFELIVNADRIKRREAIFLPPAIAGMKNAEGKLDMTGFPTGEELAHNYKNSILDSPSMIWVDPNDFVYASTDKDLSAGADFIKICREQEQIAARRRGEEKKFVDLIEIFNRFS